MTEPEQVAQDPELQQQLEASLWEAFRRGWTDTPPGWDLKPAG